MDVGILFRLAGIGIVITVICKKKKKSDRDDVATVVSIVGLVIALTMVVGTVGELFTEIQRIFSLS